MQEIDNEKKNNAKQEEPTEKENKTAQEIISEVGTEKEDKKRSKNKNLKKNLVLLAVTIILVCLFLEILLRLFLPQQLYNECYRDWYMSPKQSQLKTDPHFGWELKPNYSNCRYQSDNNKIVYRTHNSQGIRLPYETSYEKTDKKRIILLGDSFVDGMALNDSETIAVKFQEQVGEEYEVIPLAAEGYGTDQEYLILKEEGLKYEPDIVILFFYANDISDGSASYGFADKPVFSAFEKGELILINYPTSENITIPDNYYSLTKRKPVSSFFLKFSHLYSLWYHNKDKMFKNIFKRKEDYVIKSDSTYWIIEKQYDEITQGSLSRISLLLFEFKYLAKENGFEFIIVNIPHKLYVNEDVQKEFVNQFNDVELSDFGFRNLEGMFIEYTLEQNVTYVSLYDLAEENFDDFYFKSEGHWSPKGVELTAKYLYEELTKEGVI